MRARPRDQRSQRRVSIRSPHRSEGRLARLEIWPHVRTVHPHACGEIALMGAVRLTWVGTSPRLWGDSFLAVIGNPRLRYIPTPVGRFFSPSDSSRAFSVHPHACGEIEYQKCAIVKKHGTSPRLWGDWNRTIDVSRYLRYIPTPVGRFICRICRSRTGTVHPHACGEIPFAPDDFDHVDGTSPRLWGDWFMPVWDSIPGRYIPTPVGRFRGG